jgi:hypothetical protein
MAQPGQQVPNYIRYMKQGGGGDSSTCSDRMAFNVRNSKDDVKCRGPSTDLLLSFVGCHADRSFRHQLHRTLTNFFRDSWINSCSFWKWASSCNTPLNKPAHRCDFSTLNIKPMEMCGLKTEIHGKVIKQEFDFIRYRKIKIEESCCQKITKVQ